jgi:uncharacterized protein YegP (UPF0339 family)
MFLNDYVRYHREKEGKGDYRWTRFDASDNVIGKSTEGYRNEADCRANAERRDPDDVVTITYKEGEGYRWNAKAKNGDTVGASHKVFLSRATCVHNAERNGFKDSNKFRYL